MAAIGGVSVNSTGRQHGLRGRWRLNQGPVRVSRGTCFNKDLTFLAVCAGIFRPGFAILTALTTLTG